ACEQASGAIPPLVYFNCAEYAQNPELLSSHLFGHRQGAFTGANEHTTGLVEQADGGYLLLAAVHRLSYEGQEKLFSILD
ncbi:sigma 54-interacting transcriptional regulator, partial [Salmonella enterica subsp. enterica serovar Infantis]